MRCSELEKLFHWPEHDKLTGRYKLCMNIFQDGFVLQSWVAMQVNGIRILVLLEFQAAGRGGDGVDSTTQFRTKPRKAHFLWCVNTPDNIREEATRKRQFHGPRWTPQEWAEWRAANRG